MIDKLYVKSTSDWITLSVSYDKLNEYLIAIKENQPLYTNKKVAKKAGFNDLPLPPAYPSLFWQFFTLPWMENESQVILTSEIFHYNEPLFINQRYQGQITLKQLINRTDKQWAIHELTIYQKSKVVATVETTLLLTEVTYNDSL